MAKVINFDQFMSEKNNEKLDVVIFGKTYHVPMAIPAIVPIMMARAEESMSPNESTRMVMLAADAMLGKENVDEICAKGMTAKDLATLIQQLFSAINGTEEDEEQELDDESGKKQTGKKSKK